MPGQEDASKGISEALRQGLGLFGQGVNAVAQVLRSGDAAVREVDGALTGDAPRPQQGQSPTSTSEEQAARRVAALVRQAKDEAGRSGNASAPGVMARFREIVRLLFQLPLPAADAGLSDMMPSPAEALRMGLRDLRGSMALVRLANGSGSLADIDEVAGFAEDLAARLQSLPEKKQALSRPPVPEPAQQPAAAQPNSPPKPTRGRGTRGKGKAEGKKPGNPSAVAFAQAMAEEMGDAQVKRWAGELARGRITEDQFIDRWGRKAAEDNHGTPEELLARAKERAIQDGLSPDDPYLKEL